MRHGIIKLCKTGDKILLGVINHIFLFFFLAVCYKIIPLCANDFQDRNASLFLSYREDFTIASINIRELFPHGRFHL